MVIILLCMNQMLFACLLSDWVMVIIDDEYIND